jgi:hypothetical protein
MSTILRSSLLFGTIFIKFNFCISLFQFFSPTSETSSMTFLSNKKTNGKI